MNNLSEFKNLCLKPWLSIKTENFNTFSPCQSITSDYNQAAELNIETAWLSPAAGLLRYQIISGIQPELCQTCFDIEKSRASERLYFNELKSSKKFQTTESLVELQSPQFIFLDFKSRPNMILSLENQTILGNWCSQLKQFHIRGKNLFENSYLQSLLLIFFKQNIHNDLELIIESDSFNWPSEIKYFLNQFSKLTLIFNDQISKDIFHTINTDDAKAMLSKAINHDYPRAVFNIHLVINWLTAFEAPRRIKELTNAFPQLKIDLQFVTSPDSFSISDLPASLKSEVASLSRSLSLEIKTNLQAERDILDFLNIKSDLLKMQSNLKKIQSNHEYSKIASTYFDLNGNYHS